MVNFIIRKENLLQVARYMFESLGELKQPEVSKPEIRFDGRALLILEQ